jgi:hypothetical protein
MPTHFRTGINFFPPDHPFHSMGVPLIPAHWHIDGDDFDRDETGIATSYTETAVGAGTSVLTPGKGGLLLLTNAAADDNSLFLQRPTANFLLDSAKDAFWTSRFQISDAVQSDLIMGLQADDTTPLDVTDGIFFIKADGSASVDLVQEKTNAQTVRSGVHTVVAATMVELSWYYSAARQEILAAVNGQVVTSLALSANFPNTVGLCPSFGIQNGEAVAKTMTIDYWFAGEQR